MPKSPGSHPMGDKIFSFFYFSPYHEKLSQANHFFIFFISNTALSPVSTPLGFFFFWHFSLDLEKLYQKTWFLEFCTLLRFLHPFCRGGGEERGPLVPIGKLPIFDIILFKLKEWSKPFDKGHLKFTKV